MTRTPASELEAGLNRTARRTVMSDNQQLPQPDPALRRLDRLVGTWTMEGNLVGSDEQNIRGQMTFRWLAGGFFLEQRARIDFAGQQIDALELIGLRPADRHLPIDGVLRLLADTVAVPVGCPGRPGDHHGGVRGVGRDLHRLLAPGRHLRGWLAAQPRRRRDRESSLRHQRAPARGTP
jgi:Protein of unknown function (DUF1579)